MGLFWILGERTHIKSFNCACLAHGKILNKSWLLISLYNLRQVTSSLSSYFLIREMELIIPNSEWLWRSNGSSYLNCSVAVWHIGAVSSNMVFQIPHRTVCLFSGSVLSRWRVICWGIVVKKRPGSCPQEFAFHCWGEGEREAAEIRIWWSFEIVIKAMKDIVVGPWG